MHQVALDVCNNVVRLLPIPHDVCLGNRHGFWLIDCFANKWNRWGCLDLEVFLHYIKHHPIIDLQNVNKVAMLLLVPEVMHCLASHQNTSEMMLLIIWPLVMDFLVGVEEVSHGSANSSNAARDRGCVPIMENMTTHHNSFF